MIPAGENGKWRSLWANTTVVSPGMNGIPIGSRDSHSGMETESHTQFTRTEARLTAGGKEP